MRIGALVSLVACSDSSTGELLVHDTAQGGAPNTPAPTPAGAEASGTSGEPSAVPPPTDASTADGGLVVDGGGGTDAGPSPGFSGPFARERQLCFELTNKLRAKVGVAPLARAADKESCVDEQSRQESLIDTPHGKLGMCAEARQNHGDATGFGTLAFIELLLNEQFNEGPSGPHYQQMTDPTMRRVACGFYSSPAGNFWVDVDFY